MTRRLAALIAFLIAASGFVGLADAAPIAFTSRALWEATSAAFTVETFDAFDGSQTEGAGLDVGDFAVTQVGANFGAGFSNIGNSANSPNATPSVLGATASGGTGINFAFDFPIFSWGADLGGFSSIGRVTAIRILGVDYAITEGQTFFGLVETETPFTQVDVVWVSGSADGVGLDNVSYSESAAVPEPGTVTMLGMALAALIAYRSRRRGR